MSTTKKTQALARDLRDELARRLAAPFSPALAVASESFDSDQASLVKIGTGVVGAAGGLVKVQPMSWPTAQDIVGMPQRVYATHEILFVREAGVAANTLAITARIVNILSKRGCIVKMYESPNGTAPDASQFIDANLKDTIHADAQYPLAGQ